jgi:anti-sigma factor ChrR (cupin superfamily)
MTDRAAAHDLTDVAVLYALGALSQHEARSFEEHLESCETCKAELESFEITVRALAFSAPYEEPPARARAELLARMPASAPGPTVEPRKTDDEGQLISIRASEGEWRELAEGVLSKKLHVDPVTGTATSLVRMLPGAVLPVHHHKGAEQFFVIEGDCQVAGQSLTSGDYHRAEAGSTHGTTTTVKGALFLLIAPERNDIAEAGKP